MFLPILSIIEGASTGADPGTYLREFPEVIAVIPPSP